MGGWTDKMLEGDEWKPNEINCFPAIGPRRGWWGIRDIGPAGLRDRVASAVGCRHCPTLSARSRPPPPATTTTSTSSGAASVGAILGSKRLERRSMTGKRAACHRSSVHVVRGNPLPHAAAARSMRLDEPEWPLALDDHRHRHQRHPRSCPLPLARALLLRTIQ